MHEGDVIATGLAFPEGPVWQDGELVFTEIEGGVVSRWSPTAGVTRLESSTDFSAACSASIAWQVDAASANRNGSGRIG